jgi:hypothetical protein
MLFISNDARLSFLRSYPRERLPCAEVPEQLCNARRSFIPAEGDQMLVEHYWLKTNV